MNQQVNQQVNQYIDAHCHWSDPRLLSRPDFTELLQRSFAKGINFFLLGGVSPEEWQNQVQLQKNYPQKFGTCFGLHPYFVAGRDYDECEQALDQLTLCLDSAMALGEAGLDFRPHIMRDSQERQIEMLENQIELAKAFQKPMVLHVVQAHERVFRVFDMWRAPERGGFVHAFTGSIAVARKYIQYGFLISIGGAVTYDKNAKLQDCVRQLPLESLLLESDSPDQMPYIASPHLADRRWSPVEPGVNDSTSIFLVAEKIAQLRNLSVFEVLEISTSNFKRLFRL